MAFGLSLLGAQEEGAGAKRVNASGKVRDSVTGNPLPDLHLHMYCSTKTGLGGSYDTVSSGHGDFTFVGVPDDVCALQIDGRRLSLKDKFHLNGSEVEKPWIIQLIPGIVLSGTVVDERGRPIWSAHVFLARSWLLMGVRNREFNGPETTDRQGHFRFDIPRERGIAQVEDRYRLCAEYQPGVELRVAYPLTCYPRVLDRNKAEWIELHPGQSRDVTLRLTSIPGGVISGRVSGAQTILNLSLSHPDRPDFSYGGLPFLDRSIKLRDSKFELFGIPPGRYRLRATGGGPDAPLTAAEDLEVRSGKITNVQLSLTPQSLLRGRLRTDDDSPLKRGEYRRVYLKDLVEGYSDLSIDVRDDGSFQCNVRKLASYRLVIDYPQWHIASATWMGRDTAEDLNVGTGELSEPLDIVISRSVGTVEVMVPSQKGAKEGRIQLLRRVGSRVENATYLADSSIRIDLPANFKWTHIPPGIYWVFVMSELKGPYMEMEFLKQHSNFIAEVEVRKGDTSRVELKLLDLH